LVSRFLVTRDLAAGTLVQVIPETLDGKQDFYLLAERRSNRNPAPEAVWRWLSSKAEPQQL
jgi:LysR family glycine cleavage system transcriptional activator